MVVFTIPPRPKERSLTRKGDEIPDTRDDTDIKELLSEMDEYIPF